jgi:hypothetical protein
MKNSAPPSSVAPGRYTAEVNGGREGEKWSILMGEGMK